jgi:hypothetical protein
MDVNVRARLTKFLSCTLDRRADMVAAMRTGSRTCLALVLLLPFLRTSSTAAIVASSAGDVCEPAANPCVIAEEVDIAPGAMLDFGLRTLRIESGGVLDFGDSPATVRCGRLEVDVDEGEVAIRATGAGDSTTVPPIRRIEAVRQCSLEARTCFSEDDCDLGPCGVRRCDLEPWVHCSNDAMCNFGSCEDDGKCARHDRYCVTDDDCNAGPCATELTCREPQSFSLFDPAGEPVVCATNSDCALGDCTVGDGGIDLDGSVDLTLYNPHSMLIRAASDIALEGPIDVEGREAEVLLVSGLGGVTIDAPVRSTGNRGAHLFVQGKGSIVVQAPIGMNGHVAGGSVGLFSKGDVVIHDDLVAATEEGRDNAGGITLSAGLDVVVSGGTSENPIDLHSGFLSSPDSEEDDGEGYSLRMVAGRDVNLATNTRLRLDGDYSFGDLFAVRDMLFHAEMEAVVYGEGRGAPSVWIGSVRDMTIGEAASIEVRGEAGAESGHLHIHGDRDVFVDGRLRFSGTDPSFHDPAFPSSVYVRGCMIRVGEHSDVVSSAEGTSNRLEARGGLEIADGASWTCEGCPNRARVRREDNPFVNNGDFDPPLGVAVDEDLLPCPNCIDPGSGDRALCDDGLACTDDVCTDGQCGVTPDDALCDDAVFCNGAATCDAVEGCVAGEPVDCSHLDDGCYVGLCDENAESCTAVLAEVACNDGDECTNDDFCSDGICQGPRDVACGDCGSETIEWGEDCDDGDAAFQFGEACRADCQWTGCGRPTGSSGVRPTTADALFVLRTAVDLEDCEPAVCDVNGSATIDTVDALLVLRSAVGLGSACSPDD